MELQFDLDFPHGEDDIKVATPMELQFDLECPQGYDDINIASPLAISKWLGLSTRMMISKLPPHGTSN
jgi:hypothetical protein